MNDWHLCKETNTKKADGEKIKREWRVNKHNHTVDLFFRGKRQILTQLKFNFATLDNKSPKGQYETEILEGTYSTHTHTKACRRVPCVQDLKSLDGPLSGRELGQGGSATGAEGRGQGSEGQVCLEMLIRAGRGAQQRRALRQPCPDGCCVI